MDDPTVQAYVGVIDPSSESVPDAEHPSVLPTTIPEEGAMMADVIVGAVFSTSTLADEVAAEPLESVAVAVQMIVEPTSVSAAVTVYVDDVETDELPTVQAYVGVNDPSSESAAVAEQVSRESTTTPEDGEIEADVMVGSVFSTETDADDAARAPLESVEVAVQVIDEPTFVSEAVTV